MYDAFASGSRRFTLGHTWDGAPLPCAVGIAVLDALQPRGARRAGRRSAGRACATSSRQRSRDLPMVREVRGHGYLLGVEYVDPRDGESFLPRELRVAGRIDDRRARARPGDPLDAADRRRLRGRPEPVRAAVHHDRRGARARWSRGSRASSATSPKRSTASSAAAQPIARGRLGGRPPDERAASATRGRSSIQHEQPTPGGLRPPSGSRIAAPSRTSTGSTSRSARSTARDYDLIVSLGSEFAAFDDSIPWLEREQRLLREAADEDVPVLGICFGGQLLARVLGGGSFKGGQVRDRLAARAQHRSVARQRR